MPNSFLFFSEDRNKFLLNFLKHAAKNSDKLLEFGMMYHNVIIDAANKRIIEQKLQELITFLEA